MIESAWRIEECVLCGSEDLEREEESASTRCANCGSYYTDEGVRELIRQTHPLDERQLELGPGPLDEIAREARRC